MGVDGKVVRQFSLIHTLMATRVGLTIDQVLATVDGYRDTFDPYNDKEVDSVKRKFERDKSEVSRLGIVIETLSSPDAPEDNHGMRYLINPNEYVLPDGVRFSRQEIALLQLAARAWQEGSLSSDAARALNKLRSLGIEPDGTLSGIRPRITGWSGLTEAFKEILDDERTCEFRYLKPGESVAELRTVAPLALAEWQGRWYLLAWDFDRDAERTFLVPRVASRPKVVSPRPVVRADIDYSQHLVDGLEQLAASQTALVRVLPNSDADFRLGNIYGRPDASGAIRIPFADADILADELMEFGTEISIIEPASVKRLVVKRFERLLAAHGGES